MADHSHSPTIADMDGWAGALVGPGTTATCISCGQAIVMIDDGLGTWVIDDGTWRRRLIPGS